MWEVPVLADSGAVLGAAIAAPPTCLWRACVTAGLTPAVVYRGRKRAGN